MNFKRYHVSKNLFDISTVEKGRIDNGTVGYVSQTSSLTIEGGTVSFTTTAAYRGVCSGFFEIPEGTETITFNFIRNEYLGVKFVFYDNNKVWLNQDYVPTLQDIPPATANVPSGAKYVRFSFTGQITGGYSYTMSNIMLNTGSTALPYEPYSSEVWHDIPHYIHNTSTDTLTTLPAVVYANDNNATVGLNGNMEQSGTPSPSSPVTPQECGDLETTGEHTGQYKIPISSANTTTPVYLGEVQTTRKIKKLVLTGNESGAMIVDNTNHIFALRGIFNSEPELLQVGGVCTHYKYNNAVSSLVTNMQNGDFVLNKIVNDYSFTIKDDSFSTVTDFSNYLAQQYAAGTPVCVWYVLATPQTAVVNEPLRKIGTYADEVSGITIPTTAGANTLSIGTTLQPSEVTATYKGWHPVADVHERESGAWD